MFFDEQMLDEAIHALNSYLGYEELPHKRVPEWYDQMVESKRDVPCRWHPVRGGVGRTKGRFGSWSFYVSTSREEQYEKPPMIKFWFEEATGLKPSVNYFYDEDGPRLTDNYLQGVRTILRSRYLKSKTGIDDAKDILDI